MTRVSVLARVLKRTTIGPGCWVFHGGTNGRYGMVQVDRTRRYVHRIVYEAAVGPIPDGLEIDHLCRNKLCVRPSHLEAVTHQENIRRVFVGRPVPTQCKHGHPFSDTNRRDPVHGCQRCRVDYQRRYNAAQRERQAAFA